MIADVQALTDNFENPKKITENVFEVAKDYLSVGIDLDKRQFSFNLRFQKLAN